MPAPTASVAIQQAASTSTMSPLNADLLQITLNENTPAPDFTNLVFGQKFSPHMLSVDWNHKTGWSIPQIHPYGPLSLSPAAPVLHYASGLFEGMKAYRSADGSGKIRLFRADKNMERMNRSAARAGLPTFDGEEFIKMIKTLVRIDRDYVPHGEGQTLYLRPTLIGTPDTLGMGVPTEAKLYCICSPVGNYYSSGTASKPVSLLARTDVVRAWPGGTGCYKLAANYAGAIRPAMDALLEGYHQVLWLFGPDHQLTEVGAMNLFVVFRDQPVDGESTKYEIATATLDDGTILPGVTRDTILSLLRAYKAGKVQIQGLPKPQLIEVNERKVTMDEIIAKAERNQIAEVFGSGTAAVVCSIDKIGFQGVDIPVPIQADGMGTFMRTMLREVTGRQWGIIPAPEWSSVC
ncbi:probable BAT2 - branched-chain-amino-acid transaminase (cytosolic) [Melanopsichium pennsylvanicum]|uniref:branched-chain-amino-acid transaminase n=2 Tax=Melanopsichium pennsylvanicum TaxID=63383 RepID=A0AAJ5C2E9_9BASI|nr:probable BAT2-branched-chain-amino-acid transaminase (cytosolic) [Melanopsichium pennsylvanicum 4]SNX81422.1 probable BAT2 - branched-chain-amino-acid transaminase (cytosolic) [Melanopsichium pennsylvanicum]